MGVGSPYGDRKVFVLSRKPHRSAKNIIFYSENFSDLISSLKSQFSKNIYCDGGSETVHRLLQEDLIDELIISVIPVLLGDGIPLFKSGYPEKELQLVGSKSFEKGLVQFYYSLKK